MLENQIIKRVLSYYLLLFLFSTVFILVFQGFQGVLLSLLLPIVDILVVELYCRHGGKISERWFICFIFSFSLLIRVFAVFIMGWILISYNDMPFISYKDDYIYHNIAIEILSRWKFSGIGFYDDIRFSSNTYSGFPNFSAALMYFFGASVWVPRIGNALLSSITVVLSYKISVKYASKDSARFLGVLLCLSPLTIIISSLQYKDTLLLFFTVWAIYACSNILENKLLIISIITIVISFIGISFSRPATIVPIFGGFILVILANLFSTKVQHLFLKILVIIVVCFSLIYCFQRLEQLGATSMNEYYETRMNSMSKTSIHNSDANVKRLPIANYMGPPLYMAGGLFLPPVLLVSLEDVFNYRTWALLYHYAFLPFLIPALFYSFMNRKKKVIPFYLLNVYILLRVGQAFSLFSVFSLRQSLGTIFVMYLLLPMYQPTTQKWQTIIFIVSLVVILAYNLVRLLSHGLI